MNKKQIMMPLLIMFLLPLTFVSFAKAAETRLVWGFDWEGMDVEVYAPYQAYPGDTITIRVRVEAKEDLQDVWVRVWLFGSKLEGYGIWTRYISVLYDVDLSTGVVRDQNFNVEIPSDVSLGLVYSHTYCNWKVWRWPFWSDRSLDDSFRVTYLKNKAYEDLQVAYSDLLNDYDNLLADYNDLLDDYNSLSSNYSDLLDSYDTLVTDYNALNSSYYGLKSSYESLNSTYHDLLDTYARIQSDYNSLQESYNTLNADYNTLLTNYTSLQGDYDSLSSNYNTLEADYNSLESSYNSLRTSYNSLNSTYNDLKSKHDTLTSDLGTTRNLSYLFIITTIIFIATTVLFAIRKPKVQPELKTT